MILEHSNAVTLNADNYSYYRALPPVDSLSSAREIMWEGEDWQSDTVLHEVYDALRSLAWNTPFLMEEFSAVVVRGEQEGTFDVFMVDEDQLFVDVRKNVPGQQVDDTFLMMGARHAMFASATVVSLMGDVYHEVRDQAAASFSDDNILDVVQHALVSGLDANDLRRLISH